MVVPYNPYLLQMFVFHINVEVCSSIKSAKYLYKYVYKSHVQTLSNIEKSDTDGNISEIKRFVDTRWVTPLEATWTIFGFKMCENHLSVLPPPLHLSDMQMVTFKAGENLNDVAARDNATMLTMYWVANQKHTWDQDIVYKEFPKDP
nr:uncharacterized protein LOC127336928 [Lolium perenne]